MNWFKRKAKETFVPSLLKYDEIEGFNKFHSEYDKELYTDRLNPNYGSVSTRDLVSYYITDLKNPWKVWITEGSDRFFVGVRNGNIQKDHFKTKDKAQKECDERNHHIQERLNTYIRAYVDSNNRDEIMKGKFTLA